jgi:hypothetical protein
MNLSISSRPHRHLVLPCKITETPGIFCALSHMPLADVRVDAFLILLLLGMLE